MITTNVVYLMYRNLSNNNSKLNIMTQLEQFKQITNVTSKVMDLYKNNEITIEQISKIWWTFAPNSNTPNCWPSRILKKNDIDLTDELGENWDKILDLFVEEPSYLIFTYCPRNKIEFSFDLFFEIWSGLDEAVVAYNQMVEKEEINFETML